jgi:hypothetical protein
VGLIFIEVLADCQFSTQRQHGHDTMTDPTKLIAIMRVILNEFEQSLSTAPEPRNEETDPRTDHLKNQIDRLDAALKKREDHIRRQKALDRENRKNNPSR